METHPEIVSDLKAFLRNRGFPEESLIEEWWVTKGRVVDLAVIDPDTKRPVALFEAKIAASKETIRTAARQLYSYKEFIKNGPVSLYLVTRKHGEIPFEIYRLRKEIGPSEFEKINLKEFPDYHSLSSKVIIKTIAQKGDERRRSLNVLNILCWSFALLLLALLILDYLGCVSNTPERIALLGAVVGLCILPFVGKIRILGFEIERLSSKEDETLGKKRN